MCDGGRFPSVTGPDLPKFVSDVNAWVVLIREIQAKLRAVYLRYEICIQT